MRNFHFILFKNFILKSILINFCSMRNCHEAFQNILLETQLIHYSLILIMMAVIGYRGTKSRSHIT